MKYPFREGDWVNGSNSFPGWNMVSTRVKGRTEWLNGSGRMRSFFSFSPQLYCSKRSIHLKGSCMAGPPLGRISDMLPSVPSRVWRKSSIGENKKHWTEFLSTNPQLSPYAWNWLFIPQSSSMLCTWCKGLEIQVRVSVSPSRPVLELHLQLSPPVSTSSARTLNIEKRW